MWALAVILLVTGVLSATNARRLVTFVLIGSLIALVVLPNPGQAQTGLLQAIRNVLNVVHGPIQQALNMVYAVVSSIRAFYEQVVWPVNLIGQARALAAQIIAEFRAPMQGIYDATVSSAQLPNPVALESVMRNRQTSDLAALAQAYLNTYRPVPGPNDAHPVDRGLIDMDDALAMNNLKTLKLADRTGDLVLQVAERIEDEATRAAPGSAPFLTAAGAVASIQSQALMQKMIAAQLRQEAARLAHENTRRKRSGMITSEVRQDLTNMLNR
jgi:hypothetical protein